MENVRSLEFYFEFFYAKEIVTRMYTVVKQNCVGCQRSYLSQRNHSCLSLTDKELLHLYWEDILLEVDETDILRHWDTAVLCLRDVSLEFVNMYKLKINCRDWRKTDMKTVEWNSKMYKLSCQLLALKNRI